MKILVSAGEASGDLYTAELVERLRRRLPGAEFFGCAGPRMRRAGVRGVVDSRALAVVGLTEVLRHLPRVYLCFRKLLRAAAQQQPALALLTDSPDFNLRLAVRLKRLGVPVAYLVAPQVWAWRRGRLAVMRRAIDRLLCIFPFEEDFFRQRGIAADYIGHPLCCLARPQLSDEEFFRLCPLPRGLPLVALLPGSRPVEVARHLPELLAAVRCLRAQLEANFVWALPAGGFLDAVREKFREPVARLAIQMIEGRTWDVLARADVALVASGTVSIEAALLGVPMVIFYKVSRSTWWLGRPFVQVPYYSMVNLVAGRSIAPELIQNEMRGERLAAEALQLLSCPELRANMQRELKLVAAQLCAVEDPLDRAASLIEEMLLGKGLIGRDRLCQGTGV